jgi:UDP-2-acetamido-2,6-beta-L-arabino-hexul-4-ose reductase
MQLHQTTLKVLITGANGFIGKNLQLHLTQRQNVQVICFTRDHSIMQLPELLEGVDYVFHLAGINRAQDPQEFVHGNVSLTQMLCDAIKNIALKTDKKIPVVFSSSIQASNNNPYGHSKSVAEAALFALQRGYGIPVHVFRLPNVFGKWCKPNYNSVVATFCYNIARGLPIQINDPSLWITLVYVDDLISRFLQLMDGADGVDSELDDGGFTTVMPQYSATVGELAQLVNAFKESRNTLMTERVGTGLVRALYSTYVSYLPPESFAYTVPSYSDQRGVFVEMLKTPDCGQFSCFTVHSGITRGGHYHHSKTEKFLVICGQAHFKFRHVQTGETHELLTCGHKAEVVETVPGWTHDITNIGQGDMVVMLWSNELFDIMKPDTFTRSLE